MHETAGGELIIAADDSCFSGGPSVLKYDSTGKIVWYKDLYYTGRLKSNAIARSDGM